MSESDKILSQEECLLISMLKFYSVPKRINTLVAITAQKANISLRLLDWFPTNYARYNKIFINDKNVYLKYKEQLKGYSKRFFDPFCRRKRVFLKFNLKNIDKVKKVKFEYKFLQEPPFSKYENRSDGIITTVGQMNFFKWCIENDIIDYVFKNIQDIENDMNKNILERNNNRIKQKENNEPLKKNRKNTSGITKTYMKFVVKF